MDTHKNAPLTPKGREAMVRSVIEGGLTKAAAALQFNVTAKTVAKWVKRFREEGVDGLRDRSSRPLSSPSQTPPATSAAVEMLRRQRYTGKQIAAEVCISAATVSRILRRLGLNRLRNLEPAEPVRRYEREHPGELIHIDIKKLGKFNRIGHRVTGDRTGQSNLRARGQGPGWEYVHVCIDDASRIAFSKVMKSERQGCAVAFLRAAIAYYASLGVKVERVMTDNGSCYKSFAFRKACKRLRPQAHPHQTIYPEDQRQGRTLHSDQLARVGLCPRLQHFKRASRRTAKMASPLQLAPASWQYRIDATHQQTRSNQEQPLEAPHLAG
jgi:transposase